MRGLTALLVVMMVASFAQSQTQPNIQGRWDDTVCNLITNSDQYYQRRSYIFGAYSTTNRYGSLEITTQYFPGNCSANYEEFRTILTGTYQFTGNQSSVEGFYDVNFRINTKNLEVFNPNSAYLLDSDTNCALSSLVTNTLINTLHTDCYPLHLIPIQDCPVIYDIVRVNNNTLWLGNQFPGDPPAWQPPCKKANRPTEYDPYSLTLYQPYFGAGGAYYIEPFLNFDNYYPVQLYIDNNVFLKNAASALSCHWIALLLALVVVMIC